MKKTLKEQQGSWEQVTKLKAQKAEASGMYIIRNENGVFYVMKKPTQNNPTPTPVVTTPPTPTPTPVTPPRQTPGQQQNRTNSIKISDIKNGTKLVKIGAKGSIVTKIQDLLISLGYNDVSNSGKSDGKFGPKTDAMVKKYQKDNGLTDDGVVGAKTITALLIGKSYATKVEPVVNTTQPDQIQGTDGYIIKEKEKLDILQESVKKLLRKSLLELNKNKLKEQSIGGYNGLNYVSPFKQTTPVKQTISLDFNCILTNNVYGPHTKQTKSGNQVRQEYGDGIWFYNKNGLFFTKKPNDENGQILSKGKWKCDGPKDYIITLTDGRTFSSKIGKWSSYTNTQKLDKPINGGELNTVYVQAKSKNKVATKKPIIKYPDTPLTQKTKQIQKLLGMPNQTGTFGKITYGNVFQKLNATLSEQTVEPIEPATNLNPEKVFTSDYGANNTPQSVSTIANKPLTKIEDLQTLLNTKYNSGLVVDGNYGVKTADAIIKALGSK